jgi:molecular chaperone DnaK
MKSLYVIIGIDLGTTFTLISIMLADGSMVIINNLDGELLTPSVVNIHDEDNPVVGRAAVNQWAFAPTSTAALFKRRMGVLDEQGDHLPLISHPDSGKGYTAVDLSSILLRYQVKSAEAATGSKVGGVVITVPAYFESDAREATQRAGAMAGVKVLAVINEPTAAALAFGIDKAEDGIYAIYDFGGGTFDVTIMRIQGMNFEVLATVGDQNLGGSDINNLIAAKVAEAFKAEHGIEVSPMADLRVWHELLEKVETSKKTLSQSETASFMISVDGKRLVFEQSRSDFNALIAPLIDKTETCTQRALSSAKLEPKDIKDVILVGGSSRIPAARKMLEKLFGKPARTDINPDEAVARGAAIFAARMGGEAGIAMVDTKGDRVLPLPIQVEDVTSHSLGCLVQNNGTMRNSVIIPANTPVPAKLENTFALVDANQTVAEVVITSGEDGADPADCKIYGSVTLRGLPPRSPDLNSIKVKYAFNADGTLHVTITDSISGKTTSEIKKGFDNVIGKAA